MNGSSPQVIRRGDKYVLHNIDVSDLRPIQRMGLVGPVWVQVRALMEANGEYRERDKSVIGTTGIGTTEDIDRVVADMLDISWSRVNALRPRLLGRPDMARRILAGEFESSHDVQRALGMKLRVRLDEGAQLKAKLHSKYYGKGDKFHEALEPLLRYLVAWKKRDFKYPHVPPREAQKRVAKLVEAIADLEQAKADLESRSHVATLNAPAEDKRRESS